MSQTQRDFAVTLIPGDGVGPEITAATTEVLSALNAPLYWEEFHGSYLDDESDPPGLSTPLIESVLATGRVLKGTTTINNDHTMLTGLLRDRFDLYANVRPAWSAFPSQRFGPIDIVLIRENLGGLYFGIEHYVPLDGDPKAVAEATGIITRNGCRRIAEFSLKYAVRNNRRKVTVVHKANILKALTGLFLETVMDSTQAFASNLVVEDRIVDACAMQLVINPNAFDVLLTMNMFGDILADEIAGMVGGLFVSASASIGDRVGIFEPVHEALPDPAIGGIANPVGMLFSAVMLLDELGLADHAKRLHNAMASALRLIDLDADVTTQSLTDQIIAAL